MTKDKTTIKGFFINNKIGDLEGVIVSTISVFLKNTPMSYTEIIDALECAKLRVDAEAH
jgi:hypothetical protein